MSLCPHCNQFGYASAPDPLDPFPPFVARLLCTNPSCSIVHYWNCSICSQVNRNPVAFVDISELNLHLLCHQRSTKIVKVDLNSDISKKESITSPDIGTNYAARPPPSPDEFHDSSIRTSCPSCQSIVCIPKSQPSNYAIICPNGFCSLGCFWHCSECKTNCYGKKVTFASSKAYSRHLSTFHDSSTPSSNSTTSSMKSSSPNVDDSFSEYTCDREDLPNSTSDSSSHHNPSVHMNHFSKDESKTFFRMLHEGFSFADAIMKISFPDVHPDSFTINEKVLHASIADLCSKISKDAQSRLSKVIKLVQCVVSERIEQKSRTHSNPTGLYPLPTSPADIRKLFMEGRQAILPNLAHPVAEMIDDDHSYTSPIDIIAHHFGYGLPFDCAQNEVSPPSVASITESLRSCTMVFNSNHVHCKRSSCEDVDIVPSLCWSDKAEIMQQKANRKSSAWCKSMTIQPPKDRQNSALNTYIVSLGSHSGCRQNVEKRFVEDFKKLCSGTLEPFYKGSIKRMSHVHSELLTDLRDIPERVEGLFLGAGNGTYTRVFRHAINFGAKSACPSNRDRFLYQVFPSCPQCIKRREQLLPDDSSEKCNVCADWNLQCLDVIMHINVPANYPSSEVPPCGTVAPLVISTKQLKESCRIAFDKLISKEWKQSNATAFLQQNGLNAYAIENTTENAARYMRLNELSKMENMSRSQSLELQQLRKLKKSQPNMFTEFSSVTWELLDIKDYAETVMHHLCQGSSCQLAKDIDHSLKADGKHSLLLREMSGVLDSVAALRLNWLKALDEGSNGKRGGYVGENYLALIQLFPWYYSIIPSLFQIATVSENEFDEYVEPDKPISEWRVDELKAWLKAHGLTQTGKDKTGLKADLLARVTELRSSDSPPLLEEAISGAPTDSICTVAISLKAMVSRLMATEVTSNAVEEVERHIKMFMSNYERFWQSIVHKDTKTGKKKLPRWMISTKQASLLLLPETIRRFGPLRGLWEGGPRGEGGLRPVKKEISNFHGRWQVNAHNKIMQKKVLSLIMKEIDSTDQEDDDEDPDFGDRSERFYSYRKIGGLQEAISVFLDGGKPFSVLQLKCGTFGIPLSSEQLLKIERSECNQTVFGLTYFKWSMTRCLLDIDENEIHENCCFLPMLGKSQYYNETAKHRMFTAVTSKWKDLQRDGTFSLLQIPGVKYSAI